MGRRFSLRYLPCSERIAGAERLRVSPASRDVHDSQLTAEGFCAISTQIASVADAGDGVFYYAEDYHQQYLYKNPGGYCNHGFCQVSYS